MSPVSSAIGMNVAGAITSPRSGWFQRTSASTPTIRAGLEVDDRLVVRLELAGLERPADVGLERHAIDDGRVHAGLVDLEAALALALGAVHGEVGVAQQRGGVLVAGADGDADAGVDARSPSPSASNGVLQRTRAAERRPRRRRPASGGPRAGRRTRRRRAVTRCRRGAARRPRRVGGLPQEGVAGVVAEGVVDGLEVVEVEEEQRQRGASGRGAVVASACSMRSRSSARLASPVSGSWNAWCASWSSRALRSVMSRKLATRPLTPGLVEEVGDRRRRPSGTSRRGAGRAARP